MHGLIFIINTAIFQQKKYFDFMVTFHTFSRVIKFLFNTHFMNMHKNKTECSFTVPILFEVWGFLNINLRASTENSRKALH